MYELCCGADGSYFGKVANYDDTNHQELSDRKKKIDAKVQSLIQYQENLIANKSKLEKNLGIASSPRRHSTTVPSTPRRTTTIIPATPVHKQDDLRSSLRHNLQFTIWTKSTTGSKMKDNISFQEKERERIQKQLQEMTIESRHNKAEFPDGELHMRTLWAPLRNRFA